MGSQQSPNTLSLLSQRILANVCQVERERQFFNSEPFYRIEITLKSGRGSAFNLPLCRIKTQKHPRLSEPVAKAVVLDLKSLTFNLQRFEKNEKYHPAAKPISEAEIVLYAAIHWNWPVQKTREILDQLLHASTPWLRWGVDASLIEKTRLRILTDYGKEYLPRSPKRLTGVSNQSILAPQDVNKTPKKVKRLLLAEQFQVYQLIFNRFLAWQTSDAQLQTVAIEVTAGDDRRYQFERKDTGILFRGYMQVYEQESDIQLRHASHVWDTVIEKNESLRLLDIDLIKEKTAPPPLYSVEAMIKSLDSDRNQVQFELAQLIAEGYLSVNGQGLESTEKGRAVPIAEDLVQPPTKAAAKATHPLVEIDAERMICPKCGKRLVVRQGRYGRFWACSGYPACRHTQSIELETPCPQKGCTGHLVQRRSKNGDIFYGCSNYPECRHTQKSLNK